MYEKNYAIFVMHSTTIAYHTQLKKKIIDYKNLLPVIYKKAITELNKKNAFLQRNNSRHEIIFIYTQGKHNNIIKLACMNCTFTYEKRMWVYEANLAVN